MIFIDVNFFTNANACKKYLICQKKLILITLTKDN